MKIRMPHYKYLSSFGPTIDKRSMLPQEPLSLIKDHCCHTTPHSYPDLLTGVSKNEGYKYLNEQQIKEGLNKEETQRMLRTFVQNVFSYNRQNIYDVINHQYHDHLTDRDPQTMKDFVAGFLGDALQVAPNVELVRRRVSKSKKIDTLEVNSPKRTQENTKTYVFVFNADYFLENKKTKNVLENSTHHIESLRKSSFSSFSSSSLSSSSSSPSSPPPSSSSSSSLFLEENLMDYLFGTVFMAYERDRSKSLKDRQLSEIIIAYWSNFIHTGNPNKRHQQSDPHSSSAPFWAQYDSWSQSYLQLDLHPSLKHSYRSDKIALWLDLIPKLHKIESQQSLAYHQLDRFYNASTFEASGTRFDDDFTPQTTLTIPKSKKEHRLLSNLSQPQQFEHKKSNAKNPFSNRESFFSDSHSFPNYNKEHKDVKVTNQSTSNNSTTPLNFIADNLPLTITIAIGCGLLLVNLLIFSVVCLRKAMVIGRRTRCNRKLREYKIEPSSQNDKTTTELCNINHSCKKNCYCNEYSINDNVDQVKNLKVDGNYQTASNTLVYVENPKNSRMQCSVQRENLQNKMNKEKKATRTPHLEESSFIFLPNNHDNRLNLENKKDFSQNLLNSCQKETLSNIFPKQLKQGSKQEKNTGILINIKNESSVSSSHQFSPLNYNHFYTLSNIKSTSPIPPTNFSLNNTKSNTCKSVTNTNRNDLVDRELGFVTTLRQTKETSVT